MGNLNLVRVAAPTLHIGDRGGGALNFLRIDGGDAEEPALAAFAIVLTSTTGVFVVAFFVAVLCEVALRTPQPGFVVWVLLINGVEGEAGGVNLLEHEDDPCKAVCVAAVF